MAKKTLLAGIDLTGIDVEATAKVVREGIAREAPHLKKGFRSIESDVEKTVRALYDMAAGDDEEDTERDLLKRLLG